MWLRGAELLLALLAVCADAFPLPFPELDATVSQALGAARAPGCGRDSRSAGYFPDAAVYVDATGAQEAAEYGARRSMADDLHYPSDYPYRSAGPDYAAFGAPEAQAPQEERAESALEDDTPMPGDAPASVDSGREPEPLREGERIVEDGPLDVDDTEIIPLAGEDDPDARAHPPARYAAAPRHQVVM